MVAHDPATVVAGPHVVHMCRLNRHAHENLIKNFHFPLEKLLDHCHCVCHTGRAIVSTGLSVFVVVVFPNKSPRNVHCLGKNHAE